MLACGIFLTLFLNTTLLLTLPKNSQFTTCSFLPCVKFVTFTLLSLPQAFVAGSFLHSADVGLAAMTSQVDPMVVKGALFDTMLNFETDPEILHK